MHLSGLGPPRPGLCGFRLISTETIREKGESGSGSGSIITGLYLMKRNSKMSEQFQGVFVSVALCQPLLREGNPRGWVPTEPLARSIQLGPFGVGIYIMDCLWTWFKLLFILLKNAFIYLWWSAFPWHQIPKLWECTVKIHPSCQLVCLPSASMLWVYGPSFQRSFVYILANTCIFFSFIIHKWWRIKKIVLHLLF